MKGIVQLIVFIICGAVGIYFLAIHFKVIMAIIGFVFLVAFAIMLTTEDPANNNKSNQK